MTEPLHLDGLDGANPLGFLAALGTLVLADRHRPGCRLSWKQSGVSPRARLTIDGISSLNLLAEVLSQTVHEDWSAGDPAFVYNDIIACEPETFRQILCRQVTADSPNQAVLHLLAGFGSDAVLQTEGKQMGLVEPSQLSFANRQSNRYLLSAYAALVRGETNKSRSYAPAASDVVLRAVAEEWRYDDDHKELRWGPNEMRPGALSRASKTTHGGNLLAFWSFAMLPSFPTEQGLDTAGFGRIDHCVAFSWPTWDCPLPADTVRSLLLLPALQEARPDRVALRARGIANVWRSLRIPFEKGLYFTEATSV